jgi:catechol 2,3-dioxygenase-like lactoylglutathione lyase family enzyme
MEEKKPFAYNSVVLFVGDVERSKKFYTEVMGEEIELDLGKNVGFKGGLAIWEGEFARTVVFGDSSGGGYSSKRMLEIYYETDDMAKTHGILKSAGVTFVHEVVEQPWRQLTVRFLDPDGHMIEVGERMDVCIRRLAAAGESAEKIAETTTMPLEIVSAILQMQE